jgi:hypothetical protein
MILRVILPRLHLTFNTYYFKTFIMPLELSGRLVTVMPEQTGNGRNGVWKKQDFVIELAGPYPKKVCMTAWGEKADTLLEVSTGDELKVSFDIESREYNGRWYTDLKAWKIEAQAAGGQPQAQQTPQHGNRGGAAPAKTSQPATNAPFMGGDDDNDLPF